MQTADFRRLDRDHVWHPFTPMLEYSREDTPVIAAGDGFHLIDTDGKRYLDGTSSLWCNVHGHCVPEIDAAIRDQLGKVAHSTLLGLANVPSAELAAELVQRVPAGLKHVFYSDNGSTAVEAALKIAWQYHRQKGEGQTDSRNVFACLSDGYHGDTIGAVSVGGIDLFHGIYGNMLFPTLKVPAPVAMHLPPGEAAPWLRHCEAELERILSENHARIAGFVIEPLVQGAAGILVHPPGYLRQVRALTARYGIPLIADEVAVGFGRTGTLFACEQERVEPDLLCLSKGITGGYLPLAATLATEEIYAAFLAEPQAGKTFFHGHTYTGNPLACAAALASLKLFESRNVLANVERNSRLLSDRLGALSNHARMGDVRQKGIMVGIPLLRDKTRGLPFEGKLRVGHKVTLAARKRGLIIRPLGDVIVLMPAPSMPAPLVESLCDLALESIDEVLNDVG